MKILFYTPVKLLSGGGCERWHCDITNSLKKQYGLEIEIISANLGQERWNKQYLQKQLQGIAYTQLNFLIFLGVLIPTPSIILFLYKKFREVDVIHFIYGFMGQDILMALMKFITNKKIIVGHHAPIFHSSKLHNFYMKYVSRHIMKSFDFHQTLNSQDKEFLEKKWGIRNVYFIPSGVRVEKFLKIKKIKHSKLIFITVGRYALQKGYDLLVEAIEKFNNKYKNNLVEFWFVGGGELKSTIQSYARRNKNIIDLGYLDYKKLPALYARSDVYILPSREEPFGLVLIEAWASGLPVLATKTEGPKDMVKSGLNGWFIKKCSMDEIVKSISLLYKKYLTNKNCFDCFENVCRQTGKIYSIDITAKRMRSTFFQSN